MLTTKNQDLNLNVVLYSITKSFNKNINKYFNFNLGNTDDISISLTKLLDFDSIKNYFKSHVFSWINGIILNITFRDVNGPVQSVSVRSSLFYDPELD
jgi:hypothetical protein